MKRTLLLSLALALLAAPVRVPVAHAEGPPPPVEQFPYEDPVTVQSPIGVAAAISCGVSARIAILSAGVNVAATTVMLSSCLLMVLDALFDPR